jgi:hypothetical protein
MREKRLSRKGSRKKRRARCEKQDAPATIGKKDQQAERDKDSEKAHRSALRHRHTRSVFVVPPDRLSA